MPLNLPDIMIIKINSICTKVYYKLYWDLIFDYRIEIFFRMKVLDQLPGKISGPITWN